MSAPAMNHRAGDENECDQFHRAEPAVLMRGRLPVVILRRPMDIFLLMREMSHVEIHAKEAWGSPNEQ